MNPRKILPFFWIFILYLMQNASGIFFPQKTPILLISAVLFYAFAEGPWMGALAGAFAGLLLEIFGTGRFGAELIVLATAGFVFGRITRTFFRESVFMRFFVPVTAFYFVILFRALIFYIALGEGRDFSILDQCCPPRETLWVIIVYPLVFYFLKRVTDGLPKI